ncbi:hypothetical protein BGM26_01180 [Bacillus sp. FJAT-29790]|uniref:YciI family protein n=1 Tax=Bacillus sp. FJAT-29790 TaxID=1895002 RepID=UPI001C21D463|nr:YciI family protein [Bacillus sp. FJAT-29790]MBU8877599.1 hypothetical protein [Bacillus sp. FJAT-29790]
MKYFAVFLSMLNQEKSKEYREQHLHYLDQKRREGKIFANGRFVDGTGGLVIYQADSFAEVEQIAKQDPYIVHGARNFEIHEWEMVSNAVLSSMNGRTD